MKPKKVWVVEVTTANWGFFTTVRTKAEAQAEVLRLRAHYKKAGKRPKVSCREVGTYEK